MALIHINRNRENLGTFDDQDVADGLRSGRFLATDLAWREPMASWQPLSTFSDLPEVSEELGMPDQGLIEGVLPKVPVEPAWERAEPGEGIQAAVATVKQVFTTPVMTFQKMPVSGGYWRPLIFYTLVSWASGLMALIYQLVVALINPALLFGEASKDLTPVMIIFITVATGVFLPLFLVIGSFLWAGLFHLGLLLTGGATKPFEASYRAMAYACGTAAVLQIIPLCGGYLYPIANLVYSVIALKEVHRTDLWRVILAAGLLLLVCCGLVMFVITVAGAAALGSGLAE